MNVRDLMSVHVLVDRLRAAERRAVRIKAQIGRRHGHNKARWPLDELRHYNSVRKIARDLRDQIDLITGKRQS